MSAIMIFQYDPPVDPPQYKAYEQASLRQVIPSLMALPGFVEFRAYRDPTGASPQITTIVEFNKLESLMKALDTEVWQSAVTLLRRSGVTHIRTQILGASPFLPDPIQATPGAKV